MNGLDRPLQPVLGREGAAPHSDRNKPQRNHAATRTIGPEAATHTHTQGTRRQRAQTSPMCRHKGQGCMRANAKTPRPQRALSVALRYCCASSLVRRLLCTPPPPPRPAPRDERASYLPESRAACTRPSGVRGYTRPACAAPKRTKSAPHLTKSAARWLRHGPQPNRHASPLLPKRHAVQHPSSHLRSIAARARGAVAWGRRRMATQLRRTRSPGSTGATHFPKDLRSRGAPCRRQRRCVAATEVVADEALLNAKPTAAEPNAHAPWQTPWRDAAAIAASALSPGPFSNHPAANTPHHVPGSGRWRGARAAGSGLGPLPPGADDTLRPRCHTGPPAHSRPLWRNRPPQGLRTGQAPVQGDEHDLSRFQAEARRPRQLPEARLHCTATRRATLDDTRDVVRVRSAPAAPRQPAQAALGGLQD